MLPSEQDKILSIVTCELIFKDRLIRGKLFIFQSKITFCTLISQSLMSHVKMDPKQHMLNINSNIIFKKH